jgi:hypothetical protein
MPTQTIRLTLPRPLPWQRQVRAEARRFNAVAVGRRAGKSTMAHELLLRPALDGYPVAYFAPTYKLLSETWREVRRIAKPVTRSSTQTEHRIELLTGGVIEMWTLEDNDAGRSRKYKRAIVDEAGLVADLGARWNEAIRPTLADFGGDLFALGTPKGRNAFWQMWVWGNDPAMTDWYSVQLPTTVNPYIAPSEVEDMRRTMPERVYRQEVLAEFMESGGGVFRNVRAAATAPAQEAAVDGHEYVLGVDWGKQVDATVVTVLDVTERAVAAVERMTGVDYTVQIGRLQGVCRRFRPYAVMVERNSIGEPLIEQLLRLDLPIVPFTTTNATKAKIVERLELAFENGEIRVVNDPTLIAELEAFEMERLPSGLPRYSAPEGQHDDHVISLCLAWAAASSWGSLQ